MRHYTVGGEVGRGEGGMAGARTHSAEGFIDVFLEATAQQWRVWWDVLAVPVLWKKTTAMNNYYKWGL